MTEQITITTEQVECLIKNMERLDKQADRFWADDRRYDSMFYNGQSYGIMKALEILGIEY